MSPKELLSKILGVKGKKLNEVWKYMDEEGYSNSEHWGRTTHLEEFYLKVDLKQFHVKKWNLYFKQN